MNCASSPFGCPGLAAKGRRNRFTAIHQLPRRQTIYLVAFPSFPEGSLCEAFRYRRRLLVDCSI
jgi:hypothetical protein